MSVLPKSTPLTTFPYSEEEPAQWVRRRHGFVVRNPVIPEFVISDDHLTFPRLCHFDFNVGIIISSLRCSQKTVLAPVGGCQEVHFSRTKFFVHLFKVGKGKRGGRRVAGKEV